MGLSLTIFVGPIMNDKMRGIAASAVLMAAFSAVPAKADTATATSSADVLRQLTVAAGDDLSFGTFVASNSTTGHVTIEPYNARTECTVAYCGGTFSPSSFNISGQPGQVVNITHAGTSMNPITFSMTDGTNVITFGLILHTPSLTLNAAGEGSFNVGARVQVPANTPQGNYTGSYSLDLQYQ